MADCQQCGDDDEAEDNPARKDLERIRRFEERPEEREQAPEQVRAEPVEQSAGGGGSALIGTREGHAGLRDAPPAQRGLVKRFLSMPNAW
jgi:hypothetical protein